MPAATNLAWRGPRPTTDHSIQRPPSRRPGTGLRQAVLQNNIIRNPQPPPQVPLLRPEYDWGKLPEFSIKLRNLYSTTTTWDLYRNFKKHGTIVLIELFEGRNGVRDGGGKIRFSPPPRDPFWAQRGFENRFEMKSADGTERYHCFVEPDTRGKTYFKVRSPVNKTVEYDEKMTLIPESLHFGIMLGADSFMTMESINSTPGNQLSLTMELRRSQLVATFTVDFKDPRKHGDLQYTSESQISEYERKNKYKLQIPFTQLKKIYRVDLDDSKVALVVSLEHPPPFYRKREDEESSHADENLVWTEFDSWYRQTDIVYDPFRLANDPVAFHKEKPTIDIGISCFFPQVNLADKARPMDYL